MERQTYHDGKAALIERVVGSRGNSVMLLESLPNLPVARRWRNQAFPVASVLALIRRDRVSRNDVTDEGALESRFLLIQRNTEPYTGKWGLVGGRWEFGESLETAITREVKEETGLDTAFVALCGVVSERIAPLSSNDEGAHYLLFVCELHAPVGTAQEQSEGPVAWFSQEEMKEMGTSQAIISTDYAILQHFTRPGAALAYLEADVVAGGGDEAAGTLVRFASTP